MFPAPFPVRAGPIGGRGVDVLAEHGDEAKVLGGGQG